MRACAWRTLRQESHHNTQSLAKARSFVGGYCPHTPEWSALRILSRSPRLAPSLGATAPIPPNGVPSEYSVARQGSLLRWGLLPPYPRMECPPRCVCPKHGDYILCGKCRLWGYRGRTVSATNTPTGTQIHGMEAFCLWLLFGIWEACHKDRLPKTL